MTTLTTSEDTRQAGCSGRAVRINLTSEETMEVIEERKEISPGAPMAQQKEPVLAFPMQPLRSQATPLTFPSRPEMERDLTLESV